MTKDNIGPLGETNLESYELLKGSGTTKQVIQGMVTTTDQTIIDAFKSELNRRLVASVTDSIDKNAAASLKLANSVNWLDGIILLATVAMAIIMGIEFFFGSSAVVTPL